MKKLLTTVLAALLYASAAFAGAVTAPTGPLEPSQIQAIITQLVQSINSGVNGLLGTFTNQVNGGAVTTPMLFYTYTLPANTLSANGQAIKVSCWGTFAANTNTKSVDLIFAASNNLSSVQMSSAAVNSGAHINNTQWRINMTVVRVGALSSWIYGDGTVGATTFSTMISSSAVIPFNLDQTLTCNGLTGTGTANNVVATGMLVEQIK